MGQIGFGFSCRVARHVFVVDEVRADRNAEDRLVGPAHPYRAVGEHDGLAAFLFDAGDGREADFAFDPLVIVGLAVEPQVIAVGRTLNVVFVGRVVAGRESYAVFLRGGQPYDQHLVGQRDERLAGVENAVGCEARRRHRAGDVQFPAVVAVPCDVFEIEPQRPHRLVGHAVGSRGRADRRAAETLRFEVASFEKQPPDLRQRLAGRRIGVVVGRAGPHGFLVELELFVPRVAEDHSSYAAVAQGQRLLPAGRRSDVMQFQFAVRGPGGPNCSRPAQQDEQQSKVFHDR